MNALEKQAVEMRQNFSQSVTQIGQNFTQMVAQLGQKIDTLTAENVRLRAENAHKSSPHVHPPASIVINQAPPPPPISRKPEPAVTPAFHPVPGGGIPMPPGLGVSPEEWAMVTTFFLHHVGNSDEP